MSGRPICGVNPVLERLRKRPQGVRHVFAKDSVPDEVAALCRRHKVPFDIKTGDELDAILPEEVRHQGLVALVGEFVYADLDELIEAQPTLLVILDSVQDPHNLGAVVRSAHAMGAAAVVIPKDRAASVTATVTKASAGATEYLPIAKVTNIARTLQQLKKAGFQCVGAALGADAQAPTDIDLRPPTALVLGAEGKGLRRLVKERCDILAQIPMAQAFDSLNVSVAAGMLLYELARQRGFAFRA